MPVNAINWFSAQGYINHPVLGQKILIDAQVLLGAQLNLNANLN